MSCVEHVRGGYAHGPNAVVGPIKWTAEEPTVPETSE